MHPFSIREVQAGWPNASSERSSVKETSTFHMLVCLSHCDEIYRKTCAVYIHKGSLTGNLTYLFSSCALASI